MIAVQAQIEIQGDLSLANISQELEKLNFPKEILKTAIVKLKTNYYWNYADQNTKETLKNNSPEQETPKEP